MRTRATALVLTLAGLLPAQAAPTFGGCPVFPADNYWNTPIDTLPVHPFSNSWVNTIGAATRLHPDWGTDPADNYGIPYIAVGAGQPAVPICPDTSNPQCEFWDESDDGTPGKAYPIPLNAPIEGGSASTGDRHVIAVDTSTCTLYELYRAFPQAGHWNAASYARYDLTANGPLRPLGWTSADAAGLPIFPGLMRWEEVGGPGELEHAIRFTAAQIWGRDAAVNQNKYLWPARHWSGSSTISTRPPMGARFRLKASFDISGFSAPTQKILRAFKKYGLVLADAGSNWYISGTTDVNWPSQVDTELKSIAGSNFEAVDTSLLMVDVNSGQAALPTPTTTPRLANISTRMQVLTGNDVLIGGFIIGGSSSKNVVVRARGPSLIPFGITNALADPTLQLVRSSDQATLATNDDWQSAGNAAAVTASGFAPSNDAESAILTSLAPGAYTAIVSGVGNTTGVGIVEVFEVDAPAAALSNISTRGQVLTGNDVMIGGFVIQGNFPKTVIVRARGPSLVPFGITNALANPVLQVVRSSDNAVLATNDDWQATTFAAQITANGFAPANTLESAVMMTLAPGAYTTIVTGAGGGTGVAIVEVFSQ